MEFPINHPHEVFMSGQTPFQSLLECSTNTAIGFIRGLILQAIFYKAFGIVCSPEKQLALAISFTVTGFLINYVNRRFFNYWSLKHGK